jgi:dienelactone hydrolase
MDDRMEGHHVCHGSQDLFVSDESLDQALAAFQQDGNLASILQVKDAKHGFTGPAQDFSANPAFAFHQVSTEKARKQAVALLIRRLLGVVF